MFNDSIDFIFIIVVVDDGEEEEEEDLELVIKFDTFQIQTKKID